ncbi:MAG: protein kinase [Kofleriaceae bacterium]|nr:protein kinase [Kofleriaceae bacterium]MBP9165931.1 protein kinase [Kofleriaceae bacterium]MBP9857590.1 protein kinase [Kofleriaceae bacterium]
MTVVDFGICKIDESRGGVGTQQGLALGTPNYMAPEYLRGDPIDHRVDVYALGVVAWEMLARACGGKATNRRPGSTSGNAPARARSTRAWSRGTSRPKSAPPSHPRSRTTRPSAGPRFSRTCQDDPWLTPGPSGRRQDARPRVATRRHCSIAPAPPIVSTTSRRSFSRSLARSFGLKASPGLKRRNNLENPHLHRGYYASATMKHFPHSTRRSVNSSTLSARQPMARMSERESFRERTLSGGR